MNADDKKVEIVIFLCIPLLSVLVYLTTIILYTFRVIKETIKYEIALLLSITDGVFVNFESKTFKDTIKNFKEGRNV